MKVPFTYYLHDDDRWEVAETIHDKYAVLSLEEIVELVGRPFYEVKLSCEFDTETGEVTILSTEL